MRISTNIPGMISQRHLSNINNQLKTSIERLSSGFRINSASDDPQGMAFSQRLRTIISSYEKNLENIQGGISMMQTADKNIDGLSTLVRRISDLTNLAANGDKTDQDRVMYQQEVDVLMEEYTRVINSTEYNGIKLLDGSLGTSARTAGDMSGISDSSRMTVNGNVIQTGQYDVEVKRTADKATAYLNGGSVGVVGESDLLGDFFNASADGQISLNVTVNGQTISVTGEVGMADGDTVSTFINTINDALSDEGIEATAYFAGADIEPGAAGNQPGIAIRSNNYGSAYEITLSSDYNYTGTAPVMNDSTPDITLGTVINDSDLSATSKADLEITIGDFTVTDRSGASGLVSLAAGDTIADVITKINGSGASVAAVFNSEQQRLEIFDQSGGSQTLKIEESGGGFTAGDLGIFGEAQGSSLIGKSISRTRDFALQVTAPDASTATVLGNYKDSDTLFSGLKNIDVSIADSGSVLDGTRVDGGIAGVTFALENSGISVNDKFSIIVSGDSLDLEVSPGGGTDARFRLSLGDLGIDKIGLLDGAGNYDISTQANAQAMIDGNNVDNAIEYILQTRSKAGAYQSTLTEMTTMISDMITSLSEADTRISGTDYALETLRLTTLQLMQQGAVYGLSQSNLSQSFVLDLLKPIN